MHPELSENTINFLSENAPVIFHILITIHNLYLLITSHHEANEEQVDMPPGANSPNPIDRTNCNGRDADFLMCHSIESSGSSSSGYCSASSPAIINEQLSRASSSSMSLEEKVEEKEAATKRDNNYRECEDGQEHPLLRPRRRLGQRVLQVVVTKKSHKLRKRRRFIEMLHFRNHFFSPPSSSCCQVFR